MDRLTSDQLRDVASDAIEDLIEKTNGDVSQILTVLTVQIGTAIELSVGKDEEKHKRLVEALNKGLDRLHAAVQAEQQPGINISSFTL